MRRPRFQENRPFGLGAGRIEQGHDLGSSKSLSPGQVAPSQGEGHLAVSVRLPVLLGVILECLVMPN